MNLVHMVTAGRTVKGAFAWKRFQDCDEIRYAIRTVWFREVYEKRVKRHQKCINYAGEYFEKE